MCLKNIVFYIYVTEYYQGYISVEKMSLEHPINIYIELFNLRWIKIVFFCFFFSKLSYSSTEDEDESSDMNTIEENENYSEIITIIRTRNV